jgi:hypothetical protein
MNVLSGIVRKKGFALNLIGNNTHNQRAIYDITEFLYMDGEKYVITNQKTDFMHQCENKNINSIILNITAATCYDELVDINKHASISNLKLCNMLVFPTLENRNANERIYTCNGLFLAEYYLSEKYDDKKRFMNLVMRCIPK